MDYVILTSNHTARNQQIVRQRRSGTKIADIAKAHGISDCHTSAILRQLEPDLSTGQGIKLDLDEAEIADTYLSGATVRAIADDLEVSYGTIYRILHRQRVPMRPRGGRHTQ